MLFLCSFFLGSLALWLSYNHILFFGENMERQSLAASVLRLWNERLGSRLDWCRQTLFSLSLLLNRPAARQDGKKKKEKKKSLWYRKDNEWRRWDDNRRRKLPATALLLHTSVTSLSLALYLKKIINGSEGNGGQKGTGFFYQKDKNKWVQSRIFWTCIRQQAYRNWTPQHW